MSANEWTWLGDNPKQLRAPRNDRDRNATDRVQAFAYKSGVIELRSARDGEYLNSTHAIPNLRDHR